MSKPELPAPVTTLLDDEAFLGTYQPDFWTFLKRAVLLGLISSMVLSPLSITNAALVFHVDGLTMVSAMGLFLALAAIFTLLAFVVFDDHTNWLRHRGDIWHLTSLRLIYENAEQPELNASVNLADIHATHRVLWRSLRIDLETRQAFVMKYLSQPRAVEERIDTARTALMGEIADPLTPEAEESP